MSLHGFYVPCNQGGAGSTHSMHQQLPVMIGSQRALLRSPMCKRLQAGKPREEKLVLGHAAMSEQHLLETLVCIPVCEIPHLARISKHGIYSRSGFRRNNLEN